MSLSKSWKILPLIAILAVAFSGCAGSRGGSSGDDSDGGSYSSEDGSGSGSSEGRRSAPKEDIDEDKLKNAQKDAMATEKENHELRRQIFEAKNKLGLPVEQVSE